MCRRCIIPMAENQEVEISDRLRSPLLHGAQMERGPSPI